MMNSGILGKIIQYKYKPKQIVFVYPLTNRYQQWINYIVYVSSHDQLDILPIMVRCVNVSILNH